MDCCNRCGDAADELVTLSRYGDKSSDLVAESVCGGCCTRLEGQIALLSRNNPDLIALVLAMSDAIDRLHLAYCKRAELSVPNA